MAFQFRLEKILHFIRLKETVKKMEVSAATQRINYMRNRLEQISSEIQTMLNRFHSQTASQWAYYHSAKISFDAKEMTKLEKVLATEVEHLERKKRDLERLFRKKKALESLKEKQNQDYRVQENRKQQKKLDDVYQMSQGVSRFES